MNATTRFALAGLFGAALLCAAPRGLHAEQPAAAKAPPKSRNAWTLDEALQQLKLSPRDTYLQYVVLQLARREGRLEQVSAELEKLVFPGNSRQGRAAQADLFGMFAGALAVQEGLQLDTMRGQPAPNGGSADTPAVVPETTKFIMVEYEVSKDIPETVEDQETGEKRVVTRKVTQKCFKSVPGEVIPAPAPDADELLPVPQAEAEESEANPDSEPYQEASITGRVTDDESNAPTAASVRCVCLDGQTGMHPILATADADGIFVIEGLQAGKRYRLTATASKGSRTFVGVYREIAPNICADIRLTERRGKREFISAPTTPEAEAPSPQYILPPAPAPDYPPELTKTIDQAAEQSKWEKIPGPSVNLSSLEGPTVKSHPWAEMLAGRDPEVSPLSRCVPHDFYLVEFRSVAKLLDVIDSADQWSTFIYSQSVKDARTQRVGERVRKQLAVETGPLSESARQYLDEMIDQVAITGSDLFIREGSDVTLLLHFDPTCPVKDVMIRLLGIAMRSRPDATRTTGHMLGVEYVHLATPDRDISVFAAYPRPGLHVRSNSKVALRRVLEAIRGTDAAGKAVQRLGETDEFKYIGTLMPRGAKEEDGFVYLSDPFIRHMVSPQLKLTERRRLVAYNHLRMIGHAAQLYRTEQGKAPASLLDLAAADCCPGSFNEGDLKAPDGGRYTLSADGTSGICTRHGTVRFLTPCCEIPVKGQVTHEEATAYRAFVDQYNEYWRTYFDPIAIRVQVEPKRVRLETVVLPLIDNTVYTLLTKFLGGEPEHLDSLPVPKRNLFSLNVRLNKDELVEEALEWFTEKPVPGQVAEDLEPKPAMSVAARLEAALVKDDKAPETAVLRALPQLIMKGLGNQVGLHIYDQGVPFDLNLATFLGQMLGSFNGSATGNEMVNNLGVMAIAVPVAACTAPGYISFTVKDEAIVDDFLTRLDKVLPTLTSGLKADIGGIMWFESDYYKLSLKGGVTARSFTLRVGPVRLRVHCARIGKGLYITNHASVLEDIQEAEQVEAYRSLEVHVGCEEYSPDLGPKAHAMVRMRPRNWDQALPGFRLSWAENNRQSCLCNLGPLSGIARALSAPPPGEQAKTASWDDRRVQEYAARVHGVYHVCPDGGRYVLAADGKSVVCTVHGSPQDPRQAMAPADDSPTARLMRDFADLTAALAFTPEGLRAVLTIERK